MNTVTASGGQPNGSKLVFEIALDPSCSDGKQWAEEQCKGAERLDPDASEFEKRKYQEYLLKLGSLLRNEFMVPKDRAARGRNYILKQLPQHYHIRRKARSKVEKDKKEKYDFYIYGHPTSDRSGNPRSYASPNEFFHHLIWLIGGSGDTGNCACKLCNKSAKHEPESLKARITAASVTVLANTPSAAQTPPTAAPSGTSPALQATSMRRTTSTSSATARPTAVQKPSVQSLGAPTVSQPQAVQSLGAPAVSHTQAVQSLGAPTVPHTQAVQSLGAPAVPHTQAVQSLGAPAVPHTQAVQSLGAPAIAQTQAAAVAPHPAALAAAFPASFSSTAPSQTQAPALVDEPVIFREGEVVWYKHNNAWRIGVVLKLVTSDDTPQTQAKCLVKPLAHAALQIESVLKVETDLRPFLAFSVPPVNMKELQNVRMSQVDWARIQAQYAGADRQKQEIVGLEASKKAVVEIDKSYSTFNAFPLNPAEPTKQRVGGIFLGAERIAINEAVRIRLAPEEIDATWIKGLPIVMVARDIYITSDSLHFSGDIYRLEETANQQLPSEQGQLPAAMLQEQQFRNAVNKRPGSHFRWVLVQQNKDKPEAVIRGRFYESSKLMPILDRERFQAALSRGVVEDAGTYLNNRLDSAGNYIGRCKNRIEALSTSVPAGFSLSLGQGIVED
ncbi:hypothetical protein BKA67DRAFT_653623 [Truncatella angustata]|uniref:Cryptic loci regulator 2 N-terminal domain-containing protein n=1 Tax=Truncatella angustata TaxID=152316 RepID=A0A9P8UW94_9PEZI|nr:uncharacterized protein BKA67DRAFT_653623 [Truncatella angustata]KAH6660444.1 hypothetical protein BKA67DRAFT_653623 [Truncatella angustata]